MKETERQEKNTSGLTGAQDPIQFQILNPVLSDTNDGMDGIFSNPADASLSIFFGKMKRIILKLLFLE